MERHSSPCSETVAPDAAWSPTDFVGGSLCLDFCNTVGGRLNRRQSDRLESFSQLIAWHRSLRLLAAADAQRLERNAARQPMRTDQVLAEAFALRECLYGTFSALAAGSPPPESDMDALNNLLPAAVRGPVLVTGRRKGGSYSDVLEPTDDPQRLLWPVVRSAAELLTGPNLALLRKCGRCSWLFLDRTRNRSRRWCRMETCGNRAKAQRHYRRGRSDVSRPNG